MNHLQLFASERSTRCLDGVCYFVEIKKSSKFDSFLDFYCQLNLCKGKMTLKLLNIWLSFEFSPVLSHHLIIRFLHQRGFVFVGNSVFQLNIFFSLTTIFLRYFLLLVIFVNNVKQIFSHDLKSHFIYQNVVITVLYNVVSIQNCSST